ncbi:hypothetical protein VQ056_12480 [Paenibacillus sp. JTLBN-2024]
MATNSTANLIEAALVTAGIKMPTALAICAVLWPSRSNPVLGNACRNHADQVRPAWSPNARKPQGVS